MRLVRRYPLALTKEQSVSLPVGAVPIHIAAPNDQLSIWAMVNPAAPDVTCTVRIFETGEEFQEWSSDAPDGFRGDHLGTVILENGRELHIVRQVT